MVKEKMKRQREPAISDNYGEKRRHSRKTIKMKIRLRYGDVACEKLARDISLSGIFIEVDEDIAIGESLQLSIPFSNQSRNVLLNGKVARKTADGIGVVFDVYTIGIE